MVKVKKAAKSAQAKVSKSPIKKKKAVVKKKAARVVIKKKAAKVVVKKKVAKKPAVKKKVVKTVVKKKATKSAVKKKAVTQGSQTVSKTNILRATISALKDELKTLKNELRNASKREAVMSRLASQRDTAVGKFLSDWDRKAKSALEKALKLKKKKKSRK